MNSAICFCVNGDHFYVLAADRTFDLHFTGDTQCIPLYRNLSGGSRVPNVTTWGMRQFASYYGRDDISYSDIFAYTYAVLHDPAYRDIYSIDLRREFPRIPFHDDFHKWAHIGQNLLDLHIGFENAERWPLARFDTDAKPGKPMLRADKMRGIITLDLQTQLVGVPQEAWNYILGSRSALEWVLDQYKEKKPKDPAIRERFNTYRFSDHKETVIDLLQRVCTVSVRTMEMIRSLPNNSES